MQRNTYSQKIIKQVQRCGSYIRGTIEIPCFSDRILISDSFWAKRSGADRVGMLQLFTAILNRDDDFHLGPYHSEFYTFLADAILEAAAQFIIDNPYTRRAVINFPKGHCFTSIQILIRPGTLKDPDPSYTVIVNMRSCNVEDNFINDLFLSHLIAQEVLRHGFGDGHAIKPESMAINIGSLHKIIIEEN